MTRLTDRLEKLERRHGVGRNIPQIFVLRSERDESEIIGLDFYGELFARSPGESWGSLKARAAAEVERRGNPPLVTFAVYADDERPSRKPIYACP
jgi:hypothetical protein